MKPAIALLCCLVLAGCATTATVVPDQLLSCSPQPNSPADKAGATQRDVALYVVDLAAAGDDCRTKLGSVRRILKAPEND